VARQVDEEIKAARARQARQPLITELDQKTFPGFRVPGLQSAMGTDHQTFSTLPTASPVVADYHG
jgi:hypothetical protein